MRLDEKYISQNERDRFPEDTRITVSNDYYALCEMIEKLHNAIVVRFK